jgi:hypothetical protein
METKLITMILGVDLILATATVYTQLVFAMGHRTPGGGGIGSGPFHGIIPYYIGAQAWNCYAIINGITHRH